MLSRIDPNMLVFILVVVLIIFGPRVFGPRGPFLN
jgi:Sec-independent protein translocase protein TatA